MIRALITGLASSLMVVLWAAPVVVASLVTTSDRFVSASSRWWAKMVLALAGVRLSVEGREHVKEGSARFYVGNHQGALDIPILIAGLGGRVRFMAKRSLFRIPVFGWTIARGRYVPIDRGDARKTYRTLEHMLADLKRRPISFAVFPEGQRTEGTGLLPFRPGSLKVCQRSGLDIVPFTIDGSYRVYNRKSFRATPGDVRLVFSAPIAGEDAGRMTAAELCEQVRDAVARPLCAAVEGLGLDASQGGAGALRAMEETAPAPTSASRGDGSAVCLEAVR